MIMMMIIIIIIIKTLVKSPFVLNETKVNK